jgi:hypothetical protein
MEILDLDPKSCVVCGKSADYRVGLVNAYEMMVDSETKVTLTGTRTSRAYRFGPPVEAEAGLCLRCLKSAGRHDTVLIFVAFAFLFAFLGIIATLLVFLVASVAGPGHHWEQSKVWPWAFSIGYAASVARFTLNKKRKPGGPRWFTPSEWETMLATGVHPDSEATARSST